MGKLGVANLVLIGFAVVGALVVVPPLLNLAGGLLGLLIMLAIWMVIGFAAGKLVRGRSFGTLGDILMGLLGGFVGNFILGLFGVNLGGLIGAIITGIIGAVLLVYIIRIFANRDFAR
ncbi:MAG: GlsB/YeaQ/YmgE family stress response membrane protein [Chloroflexi bacterium]|nr:GlsB/YeaQ/YmgE family stress response membrane protein [Chloroflexota bacterium]